MLYNFKEITTVPDAKSLVDIILSETQRRTPTQVHPQFKISRIRSFYMRKVKYCQQAFHQRLQNIVKQFPRINDIHPFYSQLCDVLYDRDHFKLALGQIDAIRRVVDRICKDYVRLLKYSDSPYKCKMLKRAGLGRMCTAVKKLQSSLVYLEEVRQHLSRLPSINPHTRTLILTGFPNVGKSSFMNLVTNAHVEVQPYAFTTRSLYVGHFDYAYIRWQLLDTPGILDHPLSSRNTIELTAITALAYLQAAIIFIVDISEECGYTLENQVLLFENIKALFENKPIVILFNKTDKVRFEDLSPEKQALLERMEQVVNSDRVAVMKASCLLTDGVDEAKNKACEMLLAQRVEEKIDTLPVTMTVDSAIVDCSTSAPKIHIPPSVVKELRNPKLVQDSELVLSKDLEEMYGGPGVYSIDMNKEWKLKNADWQYDIPPEIFGGKNVLDYVDPDIEEKLLELEAEEAQLMKAHEEKSLENALDENEWFTTTNELDKLMRKVQLRRIERSLKRNRTRVAPLPRAVKMRAEEKVIKTKLQSMNISAVGKRRKHLFTASDNITDAANLQTLAKLKNKAITRKTLSIKNDQLLGAIQRHHEKGLEEKQKSREAIIEHYRRDMGAGRKKGRAGDADRFIGTKKPRHLFNHKRNFSSATRR